MAVIPENVPEGDEISADQLNALQQVTEQSAKNEIMLRTTGAFAEAKDNFFTGIIGGIGKAFQDGLKGIEDGLGGIFGSIVGAGREVRDGQEELEDRTDLLSPLLEYCSVSTPPGDGDALNGNGRVPFTHQIGPRRGATPMDGMIRLDGKGLWDLRAMVTASWVIAGSETRVYLRVLRPDGETIFSEQAYYTSTLSSHSATVVSSVVVPEPGYFVDVWVTASSGRGWWTGPQWTRLTAQHISRSVEGGTGGEDSAEPVPEPDPPEED